MDLRFTIYDLRFTMKLLLTLFIVHCSSIISFSQTEYEAPKLNCVRNISSAPSGTELNWSLPVTPNPCFTGYEIYASTGNINGPYSLVSTVSNPAQTSVQINPPTILLYNGTLATTTYFYMINRGSCVNPTPVTNKTSDTLNNEKPQPVVPLNKITIVNNHPVVSWIPARSTEVVAYLVYTSSNLTTPADTVFGRLNTSYTDLVNNPSRTISYKIRPLEYCETGSAFFGSITPDTIESKAMIASVASVDKCLGVISLSWNAYKFGNTSPLSYEVQTNVQNNGFITKNTVDTSRTSSLLTDFPTKAVFCIRIKANLPNGDSSFSNEICIDSINVIRKPANDYIRNISIENGNIIIDYRKDTNATTPKKVVLLRSENDILFTGLTTTPIAFEDNYSYLFSDGGLNLNNVYWYSIRLQDSCNEFHFSDTAATLRVGIKVKSNNKADVIWSGFDIDNISFDNFLLEKINGNDTVLVGTYNRNQTNYLETALFDYAADSLNEVCFRVTALFENNNDAAPRETLKSHSNIVCVQPEPKAFVPQAFVPTGKNKTFKPFLLFAKTEGYDFKIYDRWYQMVFSTNDVNASWDGVYNGDPAPLDGYLYVIKFKGKDDKEYTQTGTVMLLK
jgi:gliding motility-associated-like protein